MKNNKIIFLLIIPFILALVFILFIYLINNFKKILLLQNPEHLETNYNASHLFQNPEHLETNYKASHLFQTTDCTYWYRLPAIIKEYSQIDDRPKIAINLVNYKIGDYIFNVPYNALIDYLDLLIEKKSTLFFSENLLPGNLNNDLVNLKSKLVDEQKKNQDKKFEFEINKILKTNEDNNFFLNILLAMIEENGSFKISKNNYGYGHLLLMERNCNSDCNSCLCEHRAVYVEQGATKDLIFELRK